MKMKSLSILHCAMVVAAFHNNYVGAAPVQATCPCVPVSGPTIVQKNATTTIMNGTRVVLEPDTFSPLLDVIVYAQTCNLTTGTYSFPGKNVQLFCNLWLQVQPGVTIDVSGTSPGEAAGNVAVTTRVIYTVKANETLSLVAAGAAGATGAAGAPGAAGAAGANQGGACGSCAASKSKILNWNRRSSSKPSTVSGVCDDSCRNQPNGLPGSPGAPGTAGANGQAGGNGGHVFVTTTVTTSAKVLSTAGGVGGAGGAGGVGGAGGAGGLGGCGCRHHCVLKWPGCICNMNRDTGCSNGAQGQPGANGGNGAPGTVGAAGASGHVTSTTCI